MAKKKKHPGRKAALLLRDEGIECIIQDGWAEVFEHSILIDYSQRVGTIVCEDLDITEYIPEAWSMENWVERLRQIIAMVRAKREILRR